MLRMFQDIFTEISLILFYPVLSLVVWLVPHQEFRGQGGGPTIVLVERWLSINIRHLYWKYYLERKGYNVYLANFPLRLGDFRESAEHLSKYMERNKLTNVTLVGISSGGITSLLYLQNYNGWERVSKFISIGTPFEGTWVAIVLFWVKSGRELWPTSNLVKEMKEMKLLYPERIYCIRAKFDEMVPTGSALRGTHRVLIKVIGHNNLHVQVRATYRKIIEII